MVPHFVQYVKAEVAAGLRSLPRLHMALRVLRALASNPHARAGVESGLVELMPPILTCLLAKSLGEPVWVVATTTCRSRAHAACTALRCTA